MSVGVLVTCAIAVCVMLTWAGMTDRLVPASRAGRIAVRVGLPILAVIAVLFAVAWLVLVGTLVFN